MKKCNLLLEFSEKSVILLKPRDTGCYAEGISFKCADSWALDGAIGRGGIRRRGEGWGFTHRLIKQRGLLVTFSLQAFHSPGPQLAAPLLCSGHRVSVQKTFHGLHPFPHCQLKTAIIWVSSVKCWGLSETTAYVCPVSPSVWAEHRETEYLRTGLPNSL